MFLVLSKLLSRLVKSVNVLMRKMLVLVLLLVTVFCVLINQYGLISSSSSLNNTMARILLIAKARGFLVTVNHKIVLLM